MAVGIRVSTFGGTMTGILSPGSASVPPAAARCRLTSASVGPPGRITPSTLRPLSYWNLRIASNMPVSTQPPNSPFDGRR